MSRLLLDTHALIWWDSGSPSLGENAAKAIRTARGVYVSAASEWELAIKAALGKVAHHRSILDAALDSGFEPLAITFEHTQTVRTLKPFHKDPFDRLLVAVAMVEGLTLVSADSPLSRYPIRVINAGE